MKGRTSLLICVIFVSFSSQALQAGVRAGLRAGVNFATFANSSTFAGFPVELKTYIGPALGGILQVDVAGPVSLRFEPMYLQKGASVHFRLPYWGIEYTNSLKLEFIDLPLTVGFEIPTSVVRPYIFAGPSLSFMITDGYKKTDPSIHAGFGIACELSETVTLIADVRYVAGLTNIDTGGTEIETRGIEPLLGLTFGL